MSFASRHKREVGNFVTKSDLYNENGADHCYKILGMSIEPNQFESIVPIIDFVGHDEDGNEIVQKVSLSPDMVPNVQDILNDEEALNDIAEGKAGFKIYEYRNSKQRNKRCHSVTWVDLDEDGNEIPITE